MIKGIKQEYEYIANTVTSLTRDVEYFLEANHPRKLLKNDFNAEVVSHKTVDEWGQIKIKEILLERAGDFCMVNYMQGKGVHSNFDIYHAEPIEVAFIKEN